MLWSVQSGTEGNDAGNCVAVSMDDFIYVAGTTNGKMGGQAYGIVLFLF